MKNKLRNPTKKDIENSFKWLEKAKYELSINEYYKVKMLCRQVIRAIRRKESEMPKIKKQNK